MAIDSNFLAAELAWLDEAVNSTIEAYFRGGNRAELPPMPTPDHSPYGAMIQRHKLEETDRVVLIMALASQLQPALLDPFLIRNPNTDRSFSEFGGQIPPVGGFQPTIDTVLFLLSGGSLERRLAVLPRFGQDAPLFCSGLLASSPQPGAQMVLEPAPGVIQELSTGTGSAPRMGAGFPAQMAQTRLDWDDLILAPHTMDEIDAIVTWINHGPEILRSGAVAKRLNPGMRALFTGPPGTGKTLTATLLGKRTGRPVYRVDLSQVVSKWIGETEKNLATLFAMAEGRDWILFFDEADALFSERSSGGQANDRYANQEVSFLLQRIESFGGVAILATNLKSNIDEAFIRRFQAIVRFSLPGRKERTRLWEPLLSDHALFSPEIDISAIAADYEVTGAILTNVLRRVLVAAADQNLDVVPEALLRAAIERELFEAGHVKAR